MVVEDVEVGRLHPQIRQQTGPFFVLPGVNNEKPKLKLSLYLLTSPHSNYPTLAPQRIFGMSVHCSSSL
eukprot:scaffold16740_cov30-Cyclotella_meneghiniana.AAC.1